MTRFNNKYPYTDFHELNADWLLETVKDAADIVDGYDARLTGAEGAITTLQGEVETAGTGLLSRMNTAESDINNIEGRMTTYDQNFLNINNTFISDQGRIGALETYRSEAQIKIGNLGYSMAPLFDENAAYTAGDYVMSPTLKLHRALVNIPAGTADISDLTQFWPTDIQNFVKGVHHNFTQYETNLTVDKAEYIEYDEYYIINIRFTATANIAAHSVLFSSNISIDYATDYPGVIAASGQYNVSPFLVGTAGGIITRNALANGAFASLSAVVLK